ncbi:deoxyribodipyrimidine photo-lyase [candidate division KSB1 bacterium]|nr:deoxyribodipyrimidine photo-lyase [candidate division KSB1 bacterium]
MIQQQRIKILSKKSLPHRQFVLYWMQASQRAEYNHALEYAIQQANERNKPLVVFFGITDNFPQANERHYYFMLEGLKEVQAALQERNIKMVIRHQSPEIGAVELSKQADLVVVDRGYLKIQRAWRNYVAERIDCPLVQVESDVFVPVETASPKEEFSAGTFRPKITKLIPDFLTPMNESQLKISSLNFEFEDFDIRDIEKAISLLKIDRSVKKVSHFYGGTREAKKHLQNFIDRKLDRYPDLRNDPTLDYLSNMSPYLHFGQISPIYIALKVMESKSPGEEAYLEEMIVRRELSMNFVFYNQNYDNFEGLPAWAKKTLIEHIEDPREHLYSMEEFENAQTHDPYWNACQQEMLITGKMHGYMRMYWGKKILEWTKTPAEGMKIANFLNNIYELDGRDPNGFTGVAWCFGKHDRAWFERNIFGKVRYMNDNGLKRKFDADGYVKKIERSGDSEIR